VKAWTLGRPLSRQALSTATTNVLWSNFSVVYPNFPRTFDLFGLVDGLIGVESLISDTTTTCIRNSAVLISLTANGISSRQIEICH
jgi:hypothetical protein